MGRIPGFDPTRILGNVFHHIPLLEGVSELFEIGANAHSRDNRDLSDLWILLLNYLFRCCDELFTESAMLDGRSVFCRSYADLFAEGMDFPDDSRSFEHREEVRYMREVLRGDAESQKCIEGGVVRGICGRDFKSFLLVFGRSVLFESEEIVHTARSLVSSRDETYLLDAEELAFHFSGCRIDDFSSTVREEFLGDLAEIGEM